MMVEKGFLKSVQRRLDFVSLVLLALLSPLFVFPKDRWNWLLLTGVAAIFFGRWVFTRKFFPSTPMDALLALLVVWAALGVLMVHDGADASSKLAGLAFGIVFFYIMTGAHGSVLFLKISTLFFIFLGIVVSVVGTMSRLDGLSIPQIDKNRIINSIPRVYVKFDRAEMGINPNPLAGTLLLFIPLGIMVFLFLVNKENFPKSPLGRYAAILIMAVILGLEIFAIILSRSSGALAAFGFFLLMLGKKKRLLKACLGVVVILGLFLAMKSPELNKNEIIRDIKSSLVTSITMRVPLLRGGLAIAGANPFFGVGMDRLRETPPFVYGNAHAHNQFIHTAAEMGIPALIAYIGILLGAGWMTREVARSRIPKRMIVVMRGCAWGQIGYAIFGIADAIPLGAKPGVFFWYSLALMTSIYLYGRNRGLLLKAGGMSPSGE